MILVQPVTGFQVASVHSILELAPTLNLHEDSDYMQANAETFAKVKNAEYMMFHSAIGDKLPPPPDAPAAGVVFSPRDASLSIRPEGAPP